MFEIKTLEESVQTQQIITLDFLVLKSRLCQEAQYKVEIRENKNNPKSYWGVMTKIKDWNGIKYWDGGVIFLYNLDPENPADCEIIQNFLMQADMQYSFIYNDHYP